jgi:hypothetical protein
VLQAGVRGERGGDGLLGVEQPEHPQPCQRRGEGQLSLRPVQLCEGLGGKTFELVLVHRVDEHEAGHLVGVRGREQPNVNRSEAVAHQHVGPLESGRREGCVQVVDDRGRVQPTLNGIAEAVAGPVVGHDRGVLGELLVQPGHGGAEAATASLEHHRGTGASGDLPTFVGSWGDVQVQEVPILQLDEIARWRHPAAVDGIEDGCHNARDRDQADQASRPPPRDAHDPTSGTEPHTAEVSLTT